MIRYPSNFLPHKCLIFGNFCILITKDGFHELYSIREKKDTLFRIKIIINSISSRILNISLTKFK